MSSSFFCSNCRQLTIPSDLQKRLSNMQPRLILKILNYVIRVSFTILKVRYTFRCLIGRDYVGCNALGQRQLASSDKVDEIATCQNNLFAFYIHLQCQLNFILETPIRASAYVPSICSTDSFPSTQAPENLSYIFSSS